MTDFSSNIILVIAVTSIATYLSRSLGLDEVADYWESVIQINNWQQKKISSVL